ncbi:hypothetical protein PQX77_014650 [Marasmius sp. AFHP31]|nr:hypothetical protein PQX77_014650 [Marasmius sp. AFHP31]
MTPTVAQVLFDPADKQNVPKTTKLIQHLYKLVDMPTPPTLLPTEINEHNSVIFMAEILHFFVDLSINPTLILSMQTAFMMSTLYANSQSIVKTIIFFIRTNCLKMIFGNCLTLDHSRNFDVLQLAQKLSTSTMTNIIFEKYPHLNHRHQRLSVKGVLGIEWIGDTTVRNVDLGQEWEKGRKLADGTIDKYFGDSNVSININYNIQLSKPNHDLLQLLGSYVGVSLTADNELLKSCLFSRSAVIA